MKVVLLTFLLEFDVSRSTTSFLLVFDATPTFVTFNGGSELNEEASRKSAPNFSFRPPKVALVLGPDAADLLYFCSLLFIEEKVRL